jgi:hypothetical protein
MNTDADTTADPGELVPAFRKFPREGQVAGNLIAGCGELERLYALCLDHTLGRMQGMRI